MENLKVAVAAATVGALLLGCATVLPTGAGFETQIIQAYNERENIDVTAYILQLEQNPLTVVQLYLNQPRTNGGTELGVFMEVLNRRTADLAEYEQVVFEVDDERFTFYGAPAQRQQIIGDQSAEERAYYYATPPDVGNLVQMQQIGGLSFEDQLSEVTDTDPGQTQELVQRLILEAALAERVVVKLFAEDEVAASTTYVLTETDQEVLRRFRDAVQAEL